MQTAQESKFASIILKKNSKIYTRNKSRIGFSLLFLFGLALGIFVFFIGFPNEAKINGDHISKHLSSVFVEHETLSNCFIKTLKLSKTDITHILFIFISGFTYFCCAMLGMIVFAKGFMLGFSLMFISKVSADIASFDPIVFFWIFTLSKLLICAITVILSSETYMFSYDFRAIKQSCSVLKRAPVTYKFIFVFIRTVGASLLINFIYCCALKLLN